jgi:hypothetical protein
MAKEKDKYEKMLDEIRLNRQLQKKRLYEQAKRASKKKSREGS